MTTVIYHNPDCGTSRNVLAALKASGVKLVIVDYMQTGWTQAQLLGLFAAADVTARGALREAKSPAAELGLLEPAVSEETLIEAMVAHPVLVNRPFVCSSRGVRLCRPSERVLEVLEAPLPVPFYKEDGSLMA